MSTIYTFNNKVLKNTSNDKWLIKPAPVDPWNPLNLNPYTIRVEVPNGCELSTESDSSLTLNQVSSTVYDITRSSSNWYQGFARISVRSMDWPMPSFDTNGSNLKILGVNSNGVTNMSECFYFGQMMMGVRLCGTIPLFDTTQVTNVSYMFKDNSYVEGGALALYQQMSTQTNVPFNHGWCFSDCGKMTTTGSAELAQIPYEWGGNGD